MNHAQLVKEAEKMAAGLAPDECAKRGFVFAYVANHELRMLVDAVKDLEEKVSQWGKIAAAIGTPVLVGLVLAIIKIMLR